MATTDIDRRAVRRRSGLRLLQFAAAVLAAIAGISPYSVVHAADEPPLKIGVIGTGNIGGNLATLWAKAGHELVISSRHPEELEELARSLGPKVRVGTPREAAVFGDVVLISVPYAATPQIGRDLRSALAGKVVLDTGNPYPQRDGAMAEEARRKGTGVASAEFLPGTRLVRAFNAINYDDLRSEAHRKGERVAIPLAGDDAKHSRSRSAWCGTRGSTRSWSDRCRAPGSSMWVPRSTRGSSRRRNCERSSGSNAKADRVIRALLRGDPRTAVSPGWRGKTTDAQPAHLWRSAGAISPPRRVRRART